MRTCTPRRESIHRKSQNENKKNFYSENEHKVYLRGKEKREKDIKWLIKQ